MSDYTSGTYTINGVLLSTVTADADAGATVIFNLAGALSTFDIASATGASVTINNNVDVANNLNISTNGGSVDLASSVGALGTTSVTINGGSFTVASSLISADLLSSATLSFGASGGDLVLGSSGDSLLTLNLADVFKPIQDFTAGVDKIDDAGLSFADVTGYTISAVSGQPGVQKIVITASNGGSFTFEVTGSGLTNGTYSTTNGPLHLSADTNGGLDVGAACFLRGTRIATPNGEAPVEELRIGDLILTASGQSSPVRWIGRSTVSKRFADALRSYPVRVRAGALADNVPVRDLLLSPDHALLVDGVLAQAGALVNETSIIRELTIPDTFEYYHIELDDHSLILAEGVQAETFVDNVDRMRFDNWSEFETLYPNGKTVEELPYPRAKAHRQIPASLRARLALRAGSAAQAA
jgi:hypothetical protein